jgi:hypothetical protein
VTAGDVIGFSTYTTEGLGHFIGVELDINQVPEPTSYGLLAGLIALSSAIIRRK